METSPNDSENSNANYPIGGELSSYVKLLSRRAAGSISFRTGAGRIFRDLLLHWPVLDDCENEAQEICQRIADAAYPLTSALYAQAVEITIVIAAKPVTAPTSIDAMSTYITFDVGAKEGNERHTFLSPKNSMPDANMLAVSKGIAVLCRPLNYRYHTIKDGRGRGKHPHAGIFELSQRLINELYDQPAFIAPERVILTNVKTLISQLPTLAERVETERVNTLTTPQRHLTPAAPVIASVTSLSALPAPVRAIERKLMAYVVDRSLSQELRVGLRRIAQSLRTAYPQAIIEEAALSETMRPTIQPTKPTSVKPTPAPAPQAKTVAAHKQKPTPVPRAPVARVTSSPKVLPVTTFRYPQPVVAPTIQQTISNIPLSVRPSVVVTATPSLARKAGVQPQVLKLQPIQPLQTQQPILRQPAAPSPRPATPNAQPQQSFARPTKNPVSETPRIQQPLRKKPTSQMSPRPTTRPQPPTQPQQKRSVPQEQPRRIPPSRFHIPRPVDAPESRPANFYKGIKPKRAVTLAPKPAPTVPAVKPKIALSPKLMPCVPLLWAGLVSPSPSPAPYNPVFKGKK